MPWQALVNHVLHAILTLFTLVWGIVWIIIGVNGGEHRSLVSVDAFGNVTVQQVS